MNAIWKYKNKDVVVRANGIDYRGVLKGITQDSVTLRRLTGWIEIPIASITSLRAKEEEGGALSKNKSVDKSFYEFENGQKSDKG